MKLSVEIKSGSKITTYTADLGQTEQAVKSTVDKVESFLKSTFKKEVFTKEEK